MTSKAQNQVWVVMPVKPLAQAKSRLASVLSQLERQGLATKLLEHSLTVLREAVVQRVIAGFVVVSRDSNVLALVQQADGYILHEEINEANSDNLNWALAQAGRWLYQHNPECTLLILPADLPQLSLDDLERVIEKSAGFNANIVQGAIIVPDQRKEGTNLLLLKPANLLNFSYNFGDKSYQKHLAALERVGATVISLENANLAFDLDQPEDFYKFMAE